MKTKKLFFIVILCSFFFYSCEKEIIPSDPIGKTDGPSRKLIVGNEGQFGTNTASVSVIDLNNNMVTNNVYKNRNNLWLGDVLQSITEINESYYFVVNNSDKILVTDSNFNKKAEIAGLKGARYIKAISDTRAYVTSLFNDKIYIIDLLSNTKVSEIQRDKNWTEQMVLTGDATGKYIYVCENDTSINYITKIDVATNQVVDKITIAGYSPSQIGMTKDNNIWVLAGNNYFGKTGTLTEINTTTNQIEKSFTFPANYTLGQMAIGPNNEKYVVVVDYTAFTYGVYKFEAGATNFPANYFVTTPTNANYYGITVDQSSGDVYISDSKGFTQAGDVSRYSNTGTLLNTWTTAIGPSSFHFVQ